MHFLFKKNFSPSNVGQNDMTGILATKVNMMRALVSVLELRLLGPYTLDFINTRVCISIPVR
jgi:hypothetical protein